MKCSRKTFQYLLVNNDDRPLAWPNDTLVGLVEKCPKLTCIEGCFHYWEHMPAHRDLCELLRRQSRPPKSESTSTVPAWKQKRTGILWIRPAYRQGLQHDSTQSPWIRYAERDWDGVGCVRRELIQAAMGGAVGDIPYVGGVVKGTLSHENHKFQVLCPERGGFRHVQARISHLAFSTNHLTSI